MQTQAWNGVARKNPKVIAVEPKNKTAGKIHP